MNLQELLNSETDFASLAAMARRGFDWWVAELAGLLPQAWRAGLTRSPRLVAERRPDGWRIWKDGRPLAPVEAEEGLSRPVALALPPAAVFVRQLDLPRMSPADLRLLVAMDLDRLSPLDPSLVHFDLDVAQRETPGGQSVLLGVAPRSVVGELMEQALADGLQPKAIGMAGADDPTTLRFDFLPALRAAGDVPTQRRIVTYAWAALVVLLVLNCALLIGRDIADTNRLSALVDAQAPAVSAEMRLRGRVEGEEARRHALLDPGGGRPGLLRVLGALTQATPAAAWVQRLEWNGRAVRVTGFRKPGLDMLTVMRGASLFANAHSLATQPASAASDVQPYDIAADVAPLRSRP